MVVSRETYDGSAACSLNSNSKQLLIFDTSKGYSFGLGYRRALRLICYIYMGLHRVKMHSHVKLCRNELA